MTDQDDICKKFGLNIKIARIRKNYTQADLAEIMNVSPTYISDIERGSQNATLKTIEKFANALEVDIHKLMYFE